MDLRECAQTLDCLNFTTSHSQDLQGPIASINQFLGGALRAFLHAPRICVTYIFL